MGLKDCITTNFEAKKIGPGLRDKILKMYDEAYDQAVSAKGLSGVEAEIHAQNSIRSFLKNAEDTSRNKVQALIKQKEADRFIDALPDRLSLHKKVSLLYEKANNRGQAIADEFFAEMGEDLKRLMPNFWETTRDNGTFLEILRKAYNKDFQGELGPAAKAFVNLTEKTHKRFTSSGGIMGKLENYTLPQVHSKESIKAIQKTIQVEKGLTPDEAFAATKTKWVDQVARDADIFDDLGESLPLDKKKEVLGEVFEDVVSDGLYSQRKAFEKGETISFGFGDVDQRRNKSRSIHFKDFDTWAAYNDEWGVGTDGLLNQWASHVRSIAKDIGMLEVLGPRPTSLAKHMDNRMSLYGDGRAWARNQVNSEFRVLKGIPASGGIDSPIYKAVTGAQNLMRSSMLGAASLSAVSDVAFGANAAKMNGLSPVNTIKKYTAALYAGENEVKRVAARAGFVSNAMNGAILSDTRFAGEMAKSGWTGWLAGLTNKMSGLNAMTEAMKTGISLEFMGSLADMIDDGIRWSKLDNDFRIMLESQGLTKGDWDNVVLKAEIAQEESGARFMYINELKYQDGLDPVLSAGVANKLDDVMYYLRQLATNEATLASRAITSGAIFGDGGSGSLSKLFSSSVFMFKQFPITVIMSQTIPALRRANIDLALGEVLQGNFKNAAKALGEGRWDSMGMALIGSTVIGAGAIHLKELAKGKGVQEMDRGFWQAAFLQGGGLGLFGDYFMGDYSRFGRNPITEVTGPFGGMLADVFRATRGNLDRAMDGDDVNFKRDMFKIARRFVPGVSLWYTRAALDRIVFDNIEKALDPDFNKRVRALEKKMKREKNQEFWWRPGDNTPSFGSD